jgi:hypothetical protein
VKFVYNPGVESGLWPQNQCMGAAVRYGLFGGLLGEVARAEKQPQAGRAYVSYHLSLAACGLCSDSRRPERAESSPIADGATLTDSCCVRRQQSRMQNNRRSILRSATCLLQSLHNGPASRACSTMVN